jgi:hypothetical protein
MNPTTRAVVAAASIAAAVNFAAPAYADPDTDFANQLHSYGIYGPRDTNAWFGKIPFRTGWRRFLRPVVVKEAAVVVTVVVKRPKIRGLKRHFPSGAKGTRTPYRTCRNDP